MELARLQAWTIKPAILEGPRRDIVPALLPRALKGQTVLAPKSETGWEAKIGDTYRP